VAKLARVIHPLEGHLIAKDEKKKAAEQYGKKTPPNIVHTMPDPEETKRKARRQAARRQGSRASTILSGPATGETLGP
jgi:hypothetical protein